MYMSQTLTIFKEKEIQLHLSMNGLTPITLSANCGADYNTRLVRNSVKMTGVCSCLLP